MRKNESYHHGGTPTVCEAPMRLYLCAVSPGSPLTEEEVRLRQVKDKWERSDLGLCSFHSFLLPKLVQQLPLLMCGRDRAPSREAPIALQEELLPSAGLCALMEIIGFI